MGHIGVRLRPERARGRDSRVRHDSRKSVADSGAIVSSAVGWAFRSPVVLRRAGWLTALLLGTVLLAALAAAPRAQEAPPGELQVPPPVAVPTAWLLS